jgi:hypothetical protein
MAQRFMQRKLVAQIGYFPQLEKGFHMVSLEGPSAINFPDALCIYT